MFFFYSFRIFYVRVINELKKIIFYLFANYERITTRCVFCSAYSLYIRNKTW